MTDEGDTTTAPADGTQTASADGDWIGRPLADFLASVDYPTSYEMRSSGAPGDGYTLMLLEGREAQKVKIVEGERWMLIDVPEETMYGYAGREEVITRIALDDLGAVADPNASADREAKILREETVDGYDCWVVRGSCVGPENDIWVDRDVGLVRQVRRDSGDVTKFEYARINEVPESEFELPAGMPIKERSPGGG
ncbi:MAG: hypothetical protein GF393_06745 [Armatimonadia bacterium]|nr:hypothetical protein [Armatimonadia bacterium]